MEAVPETIIRQIDTIIRQLQELQQLLSAQARPANGNLTDQLYGALGQGPWKEYDLHLDRQHFPV